MFLLLLNNRRTVQFFKEPVFSKRDMGYDFQVLLKCPSSVTSGPDKAVRIHNTLEEDPKVTSYHASGSTVWGYTDTPLPASFPRGRKSPCGYNTMCF